MSASPPFFGWKVLCATFVLAVFGWGVGFYGPPVFLHAVVQRTGWSVALVSGAVTLHTHLRMSGSWTVSKAGRWLPRSVMPDVRVLLRTG